jgi:hypothetical protein
MMAFTFGWTRSSETSYVVVIGIVVHQAFPEGGVAVLDLIEKILEICGDQPLIFRKQRRDFTGPSCLGDVPVKGSTGQGMIKSLQGPGQSAGLFSQAEKQIIVDGMYRGP